MIKEIIYAICEALCEFKLFRRKAGGNWYRNQTNIGLRFWSRCGISPDNGEVVEVEDYTLQKK